MTKLLNLGSSKADRMFLPDTIVSYNKIMLLTVIFAERNYNPFLDIAFADRGASKFFQVEHQPCGVCRRRRSQKDRRRWKWLLYGISRILKNKKNYYTASVAMVGLLHGGVGYLTDLSIVYCFLFCLVGLAGGVPIWTSDFNLSFYWNIMEAYGLQEKVASSPLVLLQIFL